MRNRKCNRMKGYDYSRDNLYFVTICVDGMLCCLGEIIDAVETSRDLSVRHELSESESSISNSNSNEFQNVSQKIMQLNKYGKIVDAQLNWLENQYAYVVIHAKIAMPNHVHTILEIDRSLVSSQKIKIKSLSELVGAFKTTSSKLIHRTDFLDFKWKRSFHDHIIKDDKAYQNIINYIHHNPDKWENDVFNKK